MMEYGELPLLKLIACDNGKIGTYAKLVDDRELIARIRGADEPELQATGGES